MPHRVVGGGQALLDPAGQVRSGVGGRAPVAPPVGVQGEHDRAALAQRGRRVGPLRQERGRRGGHRRPRRRRQERAGPPGRQRGADGVRHERAAPDRHLGERDRLAGGGIDADRPSPGQEAQCRALRQRGRALARRAHLVSRAHRRQQPRMIVDDAMGVCEEEAVAHRRKARGRGQTGVRAAALTSAAVITARPSTRTLLLATCRGRSRGRAPPGSPNSARGDAPRGGRSPYLRPPCRAPVETGMPPPARSLAYPKPGGDGRGRGIDSEWGLQRACSISRRTTTPGTSSKGSR